MSILRHRLWLVPVAVVAAMAVAVGIGLAEVGDAPSESEMVVQRKAPTVPRPISLAEAWDLADTWARQWHGDAALVQLNSTDVNDDATGQSGFDGKRRSWNAVATWPGDPGQQLWIQITDGIVVSALEQEGASELTALRKPIFDGPAAIAAARAAKPGFGPGSGKARGMHFTLATHPDAGVTTINVSGSFRGQPAFVEIDASTGKVLAAQRLTYATIGGIIFSADAGATWHASNLTGRMVTSVTADPSLGGVGYASTAQASRIVIYRTVDGGANWVEAGRLPEDAGEWAFSIAASRLNSGATVLLVGTRTGLWVSRDGGASWSTVSGLPEGPASALAVTRGSGSRVFVNVNIDGPIASLFSSADLTSWTKEADGAFRLSRSADGATVLAIDESRPDEGKTFGRGPRALPLPSRTLPAVGAPETVLRAAGEFDGSAPIIAEAADRIEFSEDRAATWRVTLETNLASLTAAPDFASSGIAVAGGFRTGIYRSVNGGRTWALVDNEPNDVVSGSGEVVALAFLSLSDVIAVNGGGLTWEGF